MLRELVGNDDPSTPVESRGAQLVAIVKQQMMATIHIQLDEINEKSLPAADNNG